MELIDSPNAIIILLVLLLLLLLLTTYITTHNRFILILSVEVFSMYFCCIVHNCCRAVMIRYSLDCHFVRVVTVISMFYSIASSISVSLPPSLSLSLSLSVSLSLFLSSASFSPLPLPLHPPVCLSVLSVC